jgi:hypothetical protein
MAVKFSQPFFLVSQYRLSSFRLTLYTVVITFDNKILIYIVETRTEWKQIEFRRRHLSINRGEVKVNLSHGPHEGLWKSGGRASNLLILGEFQAPHTKRFTSGKRIPGAHCLVGLTTGLYALDEIKTSFPCWNRKMVPRLSRETATLDDGGKGILKTNCVLEYLQAVFYESINIHGSWWL